jgi:hypothetical protein
MAWIDHHFISVDTETNRDDIMQPVGVNDFKSKRIMWVIGKYGKSRIIDFLADLQREDEVCYDHGPAYNRQNVCPCFEETSLYSRSD